MRTKLLLFPLCLVSLNVMGQGTNLCSFVFFVVQRQPMRCCTYDKPRMLYDHHTIFYQSA